MVFLDKLFGHFPSIINVWISCTISTLLSASTEFIAWASKCIYLAVNKKRKSSTKGNQPVIF